MVTVGVGTTGVGTAAAVTAGMSVEVASKGVGPGLVMTGIGLSGGYSGWGISGCGAVSAKKYSSLGGSKDSSEDSELDWRWGVISQWYSFAGVIMGS